MAHAEVGIIGSGSWATVLAALLAHNQIRSRLWTRSVSRATCINTRHYNPDYSPDLPLSDLITATPDLAAVYATDWVIYALPSEQYAMLDAITQPCLIVSKGLTPTGKLLIEYSQSALTAVLSGPNLAGELASKLPAASVVASANASFAAQVQASLTTPYFRVYTAQDSIGVSIGGVYKNVLAIAAGACDALALGHNAKASLITRGLAELTRLVQRLGGDPQTVYGLSGIGDVMATCHAQHSRNWHYGYHRVATPDATLPHKTVEGIRSTQILYENHADLPVLAAVYAVLFDQKPVSDVIQGLLNRPVGHE